MWGLVLLLIILFQPDVQAQDYTLMIDVLEDRVEIRQETFQDIAYTLAERDVTIEIETQGLEGRPWSLLILALEDLHGPEAIPASEISWQALAPPFIDGMLVKGVPQLLAQGQGDSHLTGRIRFRFRSEGARYEAGLYDLRMRLVLSSP